MIGLMTDWGLCKGAMPRVESDLRWHGSFCVGSVSCVLATILLLWFLSVIFLSQSSTNSNQKMPKNVFFTTTSTALTEKLKK